MARHPLRQLCRITTDLLDNPVGIKRLARQVTVGGFEQLDKLSDFCRELIARL